MSRATAITVSLCYVEGYIDVKKNLKKSTKINPECKKIKCPAVSEPLCVKLKYLTSTSVTKSLYVIMVNRCELKYVSCNNGIQAIELPMFYCDHGSNATKIKKRTKRNTKGKDGTEVMDSRKQILKGSDGVVRGIRTAVPKKIRSKRNNREITPKLDVEKEKITSHLHNEVAKAEIFRVKHISTPNAQIYKDNPQKHQVFRLNENTALNIERVGQQSDVDEALYQYSDNQNQQLKKISKPKKISKGQDSKVDEALFLRPQQKGNQQELSYIIGGFKPKPPVTGYNSDTEDALLKSPQEKGQKLSKYKLKLNQGDGIDIDEAAYKRPQAPQQIGNKPIITNGLNSKLNPGYGSDIEDALHINPEQKDSQHKLSHSGGFKPKPLVTGYDSDFDEVVYQNSDQNQQLKKKFKPIKPTIDKGHDIKVQTPQKKTKLLVTGCSSDIQKAVYKSPQQNKQKWSHSNGYKSKINKGYGTYIDDASQNHENNPGGLSNSLNSKLNAGYQSDSDKALYINPQQGSQQKLNPSCGFKPKPLVAVYDSDVNEALHRSPQQNGHKLKHSNGYEPKLNQADGIDIDEAVYKRPQKLGNKPRVTKGINSKLNQGYGSDADETMYISSQQKGSQQKLSISGDYKPKPLVTEVTSDIDEALNISPPKSKGNVGINFESTKGFQLNQEKLNDREDIMKSTHNKYYSNGKNIKNSINHKLNPEHLSEVGEIAMYIPPSKSKNSNGQVTENSMNYKLNQGQMSDVEGAAIYVPPSGGKVNDGQDDNTEVHELNLGQKSDVEDAAMYIPPNKGKVSQIHEEREVLKGDDNADDHSEQSEDYKGASKEDPEIKVDEEQYNTACPTKCPVRGVMVCAKCSHGVYRTFLSVCHMRMYDCKQKDDQLQLVSRHPCTMSAPYIRTEHIPQGVVREQQDDDMVLRYLKCQHYGFKKLRPWSRLDCDFSKKNKEDNEK